MIGLGDAQTRALQEISIPMPFFGRLFFVVNRSLWQLNKENLPQTVSRK